MAQFAPLRQQTRLAHDLSCLRVGASSVAVTLLDVREYVLEVTHPILHVDTCRHVDM